MCHFLPRLWRVVPSRSKGPSQPSLSLVKRWSRSESHTTVHNLRFIGFTVSYRTFSHHFRSLRSPISLGAVIGPDVPTSFSPSCHRRYLRVFTAHSVQLSLSTPKATSPTLSSHPEAR
ncbi:hypothetical protein CRG98_018791 [Punica granatum]|uniref:Uncharacterized protein n=1 Tax=Punica granatum TaxID=22663 RepID=A0A2I0JX19_PUNGR|nr:hypothetical protein CRG98_018791 [Punica granatum]